MNRKLDVGGWTKQRFVQAKLVMDARVREIEPPDTRDMTVEVELKGGAVVQMYQLYDYDIAKDEPQGEGVVLSFDGNQHARFAAHIGKAYILYCIIEGAPGGSAATTVFYPPLPDPTAPGAPLPPKGKKAAERSADDSKIARGRRIRRYFIPVPTEGVIR